MAYNIRKNWLAAFSLIRQKPLVLLPFIFIGFLETLTLELLYFSNRRPLSLFFAPFIRKFWGERFLHYPEHLILLPRLFYYAQVVIYILLGAALCAITVQMVKNLRANLPLKANALIKNILRRYLSLFLFALFVMILMFALRRGELIIFRKLMPIAAKHLHPTLIKLSPYFLATLMFFVNVILQTFLILAIPIIIIEKKAVFRALGRSLLLGLRNFGTLFALICLPIMLYLPITLLKTGALELISKTMPEINLWLSLIGIVISIFVESFVLICATQFILEKSK
jgi:hypothetical protein